MFYYNDGTTEQLIANDTKINGQYYRPRVLVTLTKTELKKSHVFPAIAPPPLSDLFTERAYGGWSKNANGEYEQAYTDNPVPLATAMTLAKTALNTAKEEQTAIPFKTALGYVDMDIQSRANLTAAYALNNASVAIPSWTLATNVDITPTSAEFKTLCEEVSAHVIGTHIAIKALKDALPTMTVAAIKALVTDIEAKTNLLRELATIEIDMGKVGYDPAAPYAGVNNTYTTVGDYHTERLTAIPTELAALSV